MCRTEAGGATRLSPAGASEIYGQQGDECLSRGSAGDDRPCDRDPYCDRRNQDSISASSESDSWS